MLHFKVVWENYAGKIVLMSIDIDPKESVEMLDGFFSNFHMQHGSGEKI